MNSYRVWVCAACVMWLGLPGANALAIDESVLSRKPAENAPQGVKDMQVLIGDWECTPSNRQEDGTWKESSRRHTWKWYFALNGMAVQDFWFPAEESPGAPGTNVRIYDAESDSWFIAWATTRMKRFERISATYDGTEMILTGNVPPGGPMNEHDRRITFYNLSGDHFDWKYEANSENTEGEWREVARLACDRV